MANKLDMLSKSLQENLDLTAYSQVGHTHNYAGSSTAGGAATSATKLATARAINGTNFDGTAAITTANWGTARTITIGNSGKSVNGSENVSWTLAEIGAAASSHTHNYITSRGNVTAETTTNRPAVSGLSMSHAYNNGYPTNYGNVMTMKGSGDGQLLIGWSGTSGAHAPVYVRSKRDTTDANWSEWAQIYTTANKPTYSDVGAAAASHGTHVTYASATPLANGTAAVGSSSKVAREDHVHPLQTAVSGNAGSADKLSKPVSITIGNKANSFDGTSNLTYSLSDIGAAPTSHTHNYAGSSSAGGAANSVKTNLTIKLNGGTTEGTNLFTFNGSSAKTIDITPSSIGAAGSSHGTHVTYSTAAPLVAGTASAGSASNVARGDHVHPAQTSVSGNAGTATKLQTARNITIGNKTNSFDGSANISYTLSDIGAAAASHNHTSLTGVTSVGFATEGSDNGSISTTVDGSNTYFDFNLADDAGQNDQWRWRFTPSGGSLFNAMILDVTSTTASKLTVAGPVAATEFEGNASSATKLQTARTLTIGSTGKTFDGTGNVSWSLTEIGAAPTSHTHNYAASASAGGAANSVANSLSIQLNGGTATTFNGSAAKSINITPSSIGAAASSHGTHVTYSTTTPKVAGTAAVGSEGAVARGDHVHPPQTSVTGNAGTATKLATARTLTIGNSGKTFDGSANVSWSLSEIGAAASSHNHTSLIGVSGSSWTTATRNIQDDCKFEFSSHISKSATGLYPVSDNSNAIITLNRHSGNYDSQLGFSSNGKLYYRCTSGNAMTDSTAWQTIYTSSNKPTPADIGAAASSHGTHVTYSTAAPAANGTASAGSAANVSRGDHVHPLQTTVSGNAGTASKWETARTLTIGNTGKSVDGSANVSWSIAEIGALPMTGNTGAYSMTGNVEFASPANGTFRGVVGKCGVNDYWRVGGNATADNAGYMEIATCDDGNEPIYVRQYSGVYSTLTRTATLLDASGNTSFPGNVAVSKGVNAQDVTASGNVTVTGTVKIGSVTMKYNDTSESLDFIFA